MNTSEEVVEDFEAPVVAEGFNEGIETEEVAAAPAAEPKEGEGPKEGDVAGEGEKEEEEVVAKSFAEPKAAPKAAPAYQPNHKFKAMGQEKEFDEWAKKLTKDPETEKGFRELYEKAHGLEPVKQKLHRTREQLADVSDKHTRVTSFIEDSIAYRDAGDFGKLFEYWKIDPVKVAKWLSQEIEMNDASTPPHVKESYRRSVEATRRNIELERQNRQLESSHSEVAEKQLQAELHAVMSQPDVAEVQQSIDGRTGKAGTFFNMVVRHAIAVEQQEGRILSANEAVKEVMEEMGYFLKSEKAQGNPAQPKPAPIAAKTPPATLPKAPSTGGSPTKKGVTSTEDLRKLYKQKFQPEAA
jgi:hypothetical protein